MAMKSGGSYDAEDMNRSEWTACAATLGLPQKETIERVEELAESIPKAVINAAASLPSHLQSNEVVESLYDVMTGRTTACQDTLTISTAGLPRDMTGDRWQGSIARGVASNDSERCGHIGKRSGTSCIRPPHSDLKHRYS